MGQNLNEWEARNVAAKLVNSNDKRKLNYTYRAKSRKVWHNSRL